MVEGQRGWRDFEPLMPKDRKEVFEQSEKRWTDLMNAAGATLYEIQASEQEVERLEQENADVIVRGGRSRSELVEQIEALKRLEMPEEVDGKKLSNEESRKAWLLAALADDPNYKAAKLRQAEVEAELERVRHHIEFLRTQLGIVQLGMAHQDAVLGFFRKGS